MMRNGCYFMLNFFLFLRYLTLCPELFHHGGKRLDQNAKVNFKIFHTVDWNKNNYHTHISQSYTKCAGEASPSPFHKKLEMSISLDVVPPSPPPPPPTLHILYKRRGVDFLKFGNKSGDKIVFLKREGLD